jgi:hypothetical protein
MLEGRVERDRVRIGDRFAVSFQRTLRIPDDGRTYPLPPGLGAFPVHAVEEYADRVPARWREQGGVFIPMYQREAMWLFFDAAPWKPNAVKVGIGKINAVSGEAWDETLHADPQDYVVCPDQMWLDGIKAGPDVIRQFVAMPLGQGYTVESQLTGAEEFGGIQIVVFEPRPGKFPDEPPPRPVGLEMAVMSLAAPAGEMGLGAGGKMEQKIYPDRYGIETWDPHNFGSVFVHIVNSQQCRELTGLEPLPTPVSAEAYTRHGLPWFALYDEREADLPTPESLAGVKSVREIDRDKGMPADEEDASISVAESQVRKLGRSGPGGGRH